MRATRQKQILRVRPPRCNFLPIFFPAMPASPVPYDVFTAANGGGGLLNENGHWYFDRSHYDVNIGSQNGAWCNDVPYCITGWMYPSASLTYYSVSFYANVSINTQHYPTTDSLNCTFSYKPLWISTKTAAGTAIPLKVVVGSQVFTDSLPAGNFDRVFTTLQWEGDVYSHQVEIPLSRNSAASTVYVPLFINITWPRQTGDYINYYVKSTLFTINNERIETPSSSSMPIGQSATSIPTPIQTQAQSQEGGNISITVGATLGALALLGLLIAGLLWLKIRRRETAQEKKGFPPPNDIKMPQPPAWVVVTPENAPEPPSHRPFSHPEPRTQEQSTTQGIEQGRSFSIPIVSDRSTTLPSLYDSESHYTASSTDYHYQASATTSQRKESELPPYRR